MASYPFAVVAISTAAFVVALVALALAIVLLVKRQEATVLGGRVALSASTNGGLLVTDRTTGAYAELNPHSLSLQLQPDATQPSTHTRIEMWAGASDLQVVYDTDPTPSDTPPASRTVLGPTSLQTGTAQAATYKMGNDMSIVGEASSDVLQIRHGTSVVAEYGAGGMAESDVLNVADELTFSNGLSIQSVPAAEGTAAYLRISGGDVVAEGDISSTGAVLAKTALGVSDANAQLSADGQGELVWAKGGTTVMATAASSLAIAAATAFAQGADVTGTLQASTLANTNITIDGDVNVTGALSTGAATATGLTVNGNSTLSGSVSVNGNSTLSGSISVSGTASVTGPMQAGTVRTSTLEGVSSAGVAISGDASVSGKLNANEVEVTTRISAADAGVTNLKATVVGMESMQVLPNSTFASMVRYVGSLSGSEVNVSTLGIPGSLEDTLAGDVPSGHGVLMLVVNNGSNSKTLVTDDAQEFVLPATRSALLRYDSNLSTGNWTMVTANDNVPLPT